ncbi:hypothetical protein BABINDRAFT_39009 [Babjeviella inositovora NRRL Y-12698]|uniref:Vacuolar aminopeptidase 1 n=1 Tax=Babjeviella inositovora NRRL Y-12698 TaxID=984486 RepID=A0A1E3QLY2_9ASCO|nr:uncharacterized protein BABINDRAFT_39009 [Babjeviella inositovora NRRL Y-12698]ODQ78709.1 hypothetical protein BABINDRAFT_39009 [Babjeviella inositovora NRRL Y-12698]
MGSKGVEKFIALKNEATPGHSKPAEAKTTSLSPMPAVSPVFQTSKEKYTDDYLVHYAHRYIDFTYKSPTTFHVVSYIGTLLESHGFSYLSEKTSWDDLTPGLYYTTRSGTSLAAFAVGADWTPEKGVGIIGSHIDALATKLKPNSTKEKVDGYELLGVAPYAGALSNLWWDRDLGLGGRVLVKVADPTANIGYKVESKLINSSPHPIAHIPTLAPHFGAPAVGPFNPETQAVPVVGFSTGKEEEATDAEKAAPLYGRHALKLLRYIASLAEVKVEDIVQLDLDLYDVQKGILGGLSREFLFAPRVDDRICSFAAISGLIEFVVRNGGSVPKDSFSVVGLYDNEEIGSALRQGAKGGLVEAVVSRVTSAYNKGADISALIRTVYANTIILSADVNHLLNPNFKNVYLEHHAPVPNKGISVALDPNGHMATDAVGVALVEQIAKLNGDELQYFQIRNDSRSGGTIGPSLSIQTGARTIDLGIPQLSMHSIRAATGTKDIGLGVRFFEGFFDKWRAVYDSFGDL